MAGARQNNSQEFITNLSKKIENMMESSEQYNEDIVKFLSSIDGTQKGTMSVELKKQTLTLDKIHTSINKWNEKLSSVLKDSIEKTNQFGFELNVNKNDSLKTHLSIENQTLILTEIKQYLLKFDKFQEEKIKSGRNEEVKSKAGLGKIIEIFNKTYKELNSQTLVLGEIKKSIEASAIKSTEIFEKSEKNEEVKSKAGLGKIIEIFNKTHKELNSQTLVLGEIKKSLEASSVKSTEIFTKSKAEETKSKASLGKIIEIFNKTNKELNVQTLVLGEIKKSLESSSIKSEESFTKSKAEETKSKASLGKIIEIFNKTNKELNVQTLVLGEIKKSIEASAIKSTEIFEKSEKNEEVKSKAGLGKIIEIFNKTHKELNSQTLVLGEIKKSLESSSIKSEESFKKSKAEETKSKAGLGKIIEIFNKTHKELNSQTLVLGEIKKSIEASAIKSTEIFTKSKSEETKSKAGLGKIIEIFNKTYKELNSQTLVLGEIKKSLEASSVKFDELSELKNQNIVLDKIHTSINEWNEKLTSTLKDSLERSTNQYGIQLNINKNGYLKNQEALETQTLLLSEIKQHLLNFGKSEEEKLKTQKREKNQSNLGSGRIIELFNKSNKELYSQTLVLGEIKKSLEASSIKSEESFKKSKVEEGKSNVKISKLVDIESLSSAELKAQTGLLKEIKDLLTTSQKKMDAGKKDSGEQTKILKEIQSSSADWRVSFMKDLKDITNSSLNKNLEWHAKNYGVLVSIEKKIGRQAGMTDYNKSVLPDPKSLESFFGILMKFGVKAFAGIMLTLNLVGKYSTYATEGARIISESINLLVKSAEGVDLATAATSVAAIGIIGRSKIENLLKVLGQISVSGYLFGFLLIEQASNFSQAIRLLMNTSRGISMETVAKSIAIFGLLSASKIENLMKVLDSTFGQRFVSFFTGNTLLSKIHDLKQGLAILASTGKDIRIQDVIKSILIYNLIGASKLGKLIDVLKQSFGIFGSMFAGSRMKKRATQLRVAVAILAGATTDKFDKDNGIDSQKFTLEDVGKAVLIYNLIGHGVGVLLTSLMKSFGFFGNMFAGSRIEKRATSLKKAINILIGSIIDIPTDRLITSIASILIIGIAVKLMVSPLIWAGLLFPLVWLGLKVVTGGIRGLIGVVDGIKADKEKMQGASLFIATMAVFTGTLIGMSVLAALLSPVILIGSLVINIMTKAYIKVIDMVRTKKITKAEVDRVLAITAVVSALVGIAGIIISFSSKNTLDIVIKNVLMFTAVTAIIIGLSIFTVNKVKKYARDVKVLDVLATSISTLVNAITSILVAKFMENPKTTLQGVMIFGLTMLIITGSTILMLKSIKGQEISISSVVALGAVIGILIVSTMLAVFAAKLISPTDMLNVAMFMGISILIVHTVKYVYDKLKNDFSKIIKGVTSLILFTVGMAAVVTIIKIASGFIDIAATLLLVGTILLITHVAKKIGTDENYKKIMNAAKSILLVSASIYILSIAISFFSKSVFLEDVALVALSVIGIGLSFHYIGKKEKTVKDGAKAIVYTAGAIALLSLAYMIYKSSGINNSDLLTLGLSLLIVGGSFALIGMFDDTVKKGAGAIALSALAIIVLTPVMMIWKLAKVTVGDAIALGISLVSIAISMAIAGSFWKQVAKGALVLGLASLAIIALTPSLVFYKAANIGVMDSLSLAITLVLVGGAVALIGNFFVSVLKGSLAMVAVSIAVAILTVGLFIYKASGFNIIDALSLSLTIILVGGAVALVGLFFTPVIKGALALLAISFGVGILSIGLWVFKQTKFTFGDTVHLALTVLGLGIAFFLVGLEWKTVLKGAAAIAGLGGAIWVVSKGMQAWKKANVGWKDIGTIAATIAAFGIEFGIVGEFATEIIKGALAIGGLGVALWVVGQGMKVWTSAKVKMSDVKILGLTIAMLGVEFGIAGAGPVPLFIALGAAAIAGLGAALWVVGHGMKVWTSAKVKMSDVKILGATIGILGVKFAALGLASPLILLGSLAMAAVSLPLITISKSLKTFASANFTKEDGDSLSHALTSIVDGFLGGKVPGGVMASISFAAKSASRVGMMKPVIPVMIGAAKALLPISQAIKNFKSANITPEDGENIKSIIASVVKAFGFVGDIERMKKMGINFNQQSVGKTVGTLSSIGNLLSSLAQGVKSWASLEINEFEIINPGTAKAKLVLKGKRKLTNADFDNAAYGMNKVISAIGEPLAKLGRLQRGQSSGDSFLDKVFLGNYVSTGIKSLTGIGTILSSLASGVKEFALMEFTEYEVVNAGTDKAKLVPKKKRKLSDTEIQNAGWNIGKILSIVGNQFAKIGRKEARTEGDWPWSGGWVSKGIESLEGVSDILGSVTKGVLSMAYNEIPTFELVNGGTDKAKLVPGKSIKLKDDDLRRASYRIGKIISIMAYHFAKIGKGEDETGIFGGGWVSKGVKSFSGISGILKVITENVVNMAYGTFQPMELINAGTDKAKLVPGAPIKLSPDLLNKAAYSIGNIIKTIGLGFLHFGKYLKDNQEIFDMGIGAVSKMQVPIKTISIFATDWAKLKDPIKAAYSIKKYFNIIFSIFGKGNRSNSMIEEIDSAIASYTKSIVNLGRSAKSLNEFSESISKFQKLKDVKNSANDISSFISIINSNFDITKNRNLKTTMDNMGMFTTNITRIAKKADPLEKAAKSMDKIQKSMKLMKDSINSMDLKKLTLTDAMLNSMAHLSKNPEAMARAIEKSLNASFKALIEELKRNKPSGGGGGGGDTGTKTGGDTGTKTGGDTGAKTGDTGAKTGDTGNSGRPKSTTNKAGGSDDVFQINDSNRGMYQAFVEALNDTIIRTKSV